MKKHPVSKFPAPSLHSIVATQKLHDADNRKKQAPVISVASTVPPPDEATLLHVNKIAKESPFCFYYKSKLNDLL
jgi:hypothetical protein